MDNEKIKKIATYYKVAEDKVVEMFNESKKFIDEQFKNLSAEDKENRIYSMTANKFKNNIGSNTKEYKGIVFAVGDIIDSNRYNRYSQSKLYNETKLKVEETGDIVELENLYNVVVKAKEIVDSEGNTKLEVELDEKGEPIYLYPYYKADGSVSKLAGKPLPNVKDSEVREVFGIGYSEDSNPDEDTKLFKLQLKGKAINNIPKFGKIVSFTSGGREYNGTYQLNSSITDFVEIEDEYLQQGLDKVGIEGVINNFAENNNITYNTIQEWVNKYKEEPSNTIIPKELKYSYVIINDSMCMTQNFEPNDKGKCTMTFCDDNFNLDNNITIISSTMPEIADKIDFASNSTCTIIGQMSIFGKEGEEPTVYLNLMGAIGKKDLFVPRVEVQPIGEEEDNTSSEKTEEQKEEEPVKKAW